MLSLGFTLWDWKQGFGVGDLFRIQGTGGGSREGKTGKKDPSQLLLEKKKRQVNALGKWGSVILGILWGTKTINLESFIQWLLTFVSGRWWYVSPSPACTSMFVRPKVESLLPTMSQKVLKQRAAIEAFNCGTRSHLKASATAATREQRAAGDGQVQIGAYAEGHTNLAMEDCLTVRTQVFCAFYLSFSTMKMGKQQQWLQAHTLC